MYRSIFMCMLLTLSASAYRLSSSSQGLSLSHDPVAPAEEECVAESGYDLRANRPPRDQAWDPTDAEFLDSKFGCYITCIFRKNGELTEDGMSVDPAKVLSNTFITDSDRESITHIWTECSKQRGANACETLSKTFVCLHNNEKYRDFAYLPPLANRRQATTTTAPLDSVPSSSSTI